ncbi:MAG: protein kinase [Sandaracinaceae bacterium]|nr:protein kinase [Sandaracinaceae bacterium]
MGSVWRGTHAVTGRKIAVKILDEKFLSNANVVQRFGREARAASSIAHEGIVEVLDLDQTEEGVPFLVMEFLEGESLAHRIDYGERMNEEQVVSLGAQLLDALHAAHESGVVHRDLKPDNIYVIPGARGECIKILDFGISWKDDEQDAKLTVTGSVLGTPHYMSPEQAMGDTDTDRRVDIYAAGVVLYECIVGAVPFEGANYNKLLRVILDSAPTPPSKRGAKLSAAVEAVILKALSKRKEDRPGTAAEMRHMLLRASREEPSRPSGVSPRVVLPELPDPSGGGRGSAAPATSGLPSSTGASRSDESVAMRWLGADLDDPEPSPPPRSRPEVAVPVRADATPRKSPGPGLQDIDALGDGPSSGSIEIDERALARKVGTSSTRQSLSRMPAVGASSTRSSSGGIPAVGVAPIEPPRPTPPPPVVSGTTTARTAVVAAPAESAPAEGSSSFVRWALIIVAAVCAVGLVAFGLRSVVTRPPRPTAPAATVPTPPSTERQPPTKQPPPGAAFVQIEIEVTPPEADARMRLDGIPGATSPIRVRRGTRHVLEVSAPGFVDSRVELRAERDQRVDVQLERSP